SRQAVIQLFDAKDILKSRKDIPCTCTLQFIVREGKVDMFTSMRSNDAFLGLPHDVFAFTMIQEIVANSINCSVGEYKHYVGSLHLYENNFINAKSYLESGWHKQIEMPPMPVCDPAISLGLFLECEQKIRDGNEIDYESLALDDYWKDLIRVLQFFRYTKFDSERIKADSILDQIVNDIYKPYLLKRKIQKASAPTLIPSQLDIFDKEQGTGDA
ncbi:thymidylate synthase, partial [Pseudomonas syringae]